MSGRHGKVFDFPYWAAAFLDAACPATGAGEPGATGGRSAHIRALIAADVRASFARVGGYGDRRLLGAVRPVKLCQAEGIRQIALQVPPPFREVLAARCRALGLTQAEYIVALLVVDGARRGVNVDGFYLRD